MTPESSIAPSNLQERSAGLAQSIEELRRRVMTSCGLRMVIADGLERLHRNTYPAHLQTACSYF
jgi:hypothetical protein